MARRSKKASDNLLTIMARAHYCVGLITGLALFVLIHFGLPLGFSHVFQNLPGAMDRGPVRLPDPIRASLTLLAWAAMLACWMAAAVSWWKRRARRRLLDTQTGIDSLRTMSWQDFERVVAEAFRRQGYRVEETGGGGADGGIDLLLRRRGRTVMVQCKHWRSTRISAPTVREMWGLVAHHGFDGVKIVSVGDFTPEAHAFAQGKAMELVNGQALLELVRSVQAGAKAQPASAHDMRPLRRNGRLAPECPQCASPMKVRQPKNGGDRFLGCSKFPQCRGTRPLKG